MEVTPVLNWLVAQIKGESRAVNLWAVDYPSFAKHLRGLRHRGGAGPRASPTTW